MLPDMIAGTLIALISRGEGLEQRLLTGAGSLSVPHAPDRGIWRGEDFAIW
ncbi:MAG: hypothetical protein ACHQ7N_19350 [Candidatus Methylomirabilales bacterium]